MNRLNNLLPSDASYDILHTYLKTKKLPEQVIRSKFVEKYKGFKLKENKIFYHDLEVVKKSEVQDKLTEIFSTDMNVISKGVTNLYKYISGKYIGITRQNISDRVRELPSYQMQIKYTHRTNKPITSSVTGPNLMWCVDLLDLSNYSSHNKNWRYLFVCVDTFSRKIWIEKMKDKTAETTTNALQSIVDRTNITPSLMLSDRRSFCRILRTK